MKLKWIKDKFDVWTAKISDSVEVYILDSPIATSRNDTHPRRKRVYLDVGDHSLKSTQVQDDERDAMFHAQAIADAFQKGEKR